MTEKRPALGRGLSALIPDAPPAHKVAINEIDIDQLVPNPDQPRTEMDGAKLDELAQSIRVSFNRSSCEKLRIGTKSSRGSGGGVPRNGRVCCVYRLLSAM